MLKGKKVAILAADMFERVELEEPRKALEDAGAEVEIVSIHDGEIQGFDHFDPANTVRSTRRSRRSSPDDYDALLIPGGVGNPDQLRGDENAVAFVRGFDEAGKPMAVICHGPWMLVEAGVVRGRRVTSWPTLETDIRNAGGDWVDEEVVVDGDLVTSRKPDDIPAFNERCAAVLGGTGAGLRSDKRGQPTRMMKKAIATYWQATAKPDPLPAVFGYHGSSTRSRSSPSPASTSRSPSSSSAPAELARPT